MVFGVKFLTVAGDLTNATDIAESLLPFLRYSMKYFLAFEQLQVRVADTDVVVTDDIMGVDGA
jgi:hypothetical protein